MNIGTIHLNAPFRLLGRSAHSRVGCQPQCRLGSDRKAAPLTIMDTFVRFSSLVRQGLRFRRRFELAKELIEPRDFDWYPYDCFASLFYLQRLLREAALSLDEIIGTDPVLDLGAADGALSFFLESLGRRVHAVDHSDTNINRMRGLRALAAALHSRVQIRDVDLDGRFDLNEQYGAVLFLGTLYHLKNPFYVLELLARHARFCFLSTRVARLSADRSIRLDGMPVAYLLDGAECNADATNYWIFSPPGLTLLAKRAGWHICSSATSGISESDPRTIQGDERMFLLLRRDRLETSEHSR
jgi:tRNA (mo5U34)-methyltransferase